MPPDELSIDIQPETDTSALVFGLRGSLDIATSPSLRAALLEAAGQGKRELVVDLRGVEFIDSTGLGSLIGAHRRARQEGGSLRLVVNEGPLSRLFTITGLVRVFSIYGTLDDALRETRRAVTQP